MPQSEETLDQPNHNIQQATPNIVGVYDGNLFDNYHVTITGQQITTFAEDPESCCAAAYSHPSAANLGAWIWFHQSSYEDACWFYTAGEGASSQTDSESIDLHLEYTNGTSFSGLAIWAGNGPLGQVTS